MLAFREHDALSPALEQKPSVPGRRTQVVQTSSRPGFDDYRGSDQMFKRGEYIAANGEIHSRLHKLIAGALR